jgi:hypothetical protein
MLSQPLIRPGGEPLGRADGRIRTGDPVLTMHVLWPTELRRRGRMVPPSLPQRYQRFGIVFCRSCPLCPHLRHQRNPNEGAENGSMPRDSASSGRILTMEVLYQLSYVGTDDQS